MPGTADANSAALADAAIKLDPNFAPAWALRARGSHRAVLQRFLGRREHVRGGSRRGLGARVRVGSSNGEQDRYEARWHAFARRPSSKCTRRI
jgi:hypothetical protein